MLKCDAFLVESQGLWGSSFIEACNVGLRIDTWSVLPDSLYMQWKKEIDKLWAQKWWILAFCALCFVIADFSVIRSVAHCTPDCSDVREPHVAACYESRCSDTLLVSGLSFLAPTGLLSAYIMMPVNYADRIKENIGFNGGLIYGAETHAVVEDDLDSADTQSVTAKDSDSYLTYTFLVHKLRVLFSLPLWIWFYWLLFVRLREIIKQKMAYRVVVSLVMAAFLLLGLLLKADFGGGKDLTWQYIFNLPEPKSVDYAG